MVIDRAARLWLVVALLRVSGAITATAFLAMFLPWETMASVHADLGLGELQRTPVLEYLARSAAALYGFHGALQLFVSRDPVGYRSVVLFIAWTNALFGAMLIVIDLQAGLPMWWLLAEGPPIVGFGIALAMLMGSRARSLQ